MTCMYKEIKRCGNKKVNIINQVFDDLENSAGKKKTSDHNLSSTSREQS